MLFCFRANKIFSAFGNLGENGELPYPISPQNLTMLYHYLLTGIRILKKYRAHSFINIFGLSLGLAGAMLSILFVIDEFSFDRFHSKGDRIFRINKVVTGPDGSTEKNAESSGLLGPTMAGEQGEIEKVVRYSPSYIEVVLSHEDKNYIIKEMELVYTDSTFFQVFDFEWVEGNAATALSRPATMVINEELAASLFGNTSPIGKSVIGIEGVEFEITGVIKAPPRNSHLQFKGLMSWSSTQTEGSPIFQSWMNRITPQGIATYLLLKDPADKQKIEQAFPDFMARHMPDQKDRYAYYLQPFFDTYLQSSDVSGLRMSKMGSLGFIYLFSIIAGFILIIACINYLNISIARASKRAKEVGMRKSLGAGKGQLLTQFLGESFLFTGVASLLSVGLLFLAIPQFNELLDKSLTISLLLDKQVILLLCALIVIVTFLSGAYPAMVIASFKAITTLKGLTKTSAAGIASRHTLILIQFCISIAIISGTVIIYQQVKMVLDRDLGFDKENVLVINMSRDVREKKDIFADEIRRLSGVESVSVCNMALGGGSYTTMVIPEGFNPNEVESRMFAVDYEFADTYRLKMQSGRFFDRDRASDSLAIVINETMERRLKWDNAIDKVIKLEEEGPAYRVIGIVSDFHFKPLYEEIEPFIMFINVERGRNASVRFSGNPSNLLPGLESAWKTFETKYPFNFYFVDARLNQAYQSEERLLRAVIIFGSISIILSCLGLYGVVLFMLEQKTKEIGIRKVMGATLSNIMVLISRRFVLIILLSGLVATPLVMWQINKWLSKFTIKIDLTFYPFLISVMLIALIAFGTMALQIIRVGKQSPTISLKEQ